MFSSSLRNKWFRTGIITFSACLCGAIYADLNWQDTKNRSSLTVNMTELPNTHRSLLTQMSHLSSMAKSKNIHPEIFVEASSHGILSFLRSSSLSPNASTHHVLRIQAANFLQLYHTFLDAMLTKKASNLDLDVLEYNVYMRSKAQDFKLAFDFIDFKHDEVSQTICDLLKLNKIDFARQARDPQKLRKAFDQLLKPILSQISDEKCDDVSFVSSVRDNDSYYQREQRDQKRYLQILMNDSDVDDIDTDLDETEINLRGFGEKCDLFDAELMAVYAHCSYLGEWTTFMEIGDSLLAKHQWLDAINSHGLRYNGHRDGIDFADCYWICKKSHITDRNSPYFQPNRAMYELLFDTKDIENIELEIKSIENGNDSHFYVHGQQNLVEWSKDIKDENDQALNSMSIRRLGAVQKACSISKCVKRVQGPIFSDGCLKMRGSVVFLAPIMNDSSVVGDIPVMININEFAKFEQIEEWDLKPSKENKNILKGTIIVTRRRLFDDCVPDSEEFEYRIHYECKMKVAQSSKDYWST